MHSYFLTILFFKQRPSVGGTMGRPIHIEYKIHYSQKVPHTFQIHTYPPNRYASWLMSHREVMTSYWLGRHDARSVMTCWRGCGNRDYNVEIANTMHAKNASNDKKLRKTAPGIFSTTIVSINGHLRLVTTYVLFPLVALIKTLSSLSRGE